MQVSELLARTQTTGISCDSRRVSPGNIFFAIDGTRLKGGDFVAEALQRGAAAIVCSMSCVLPDIPSSIPVVRVTDVRKALAESADIYYQHPSQKIFAVGITGTNGKTTISYLLEALWGPEKTGVMGTVNIRWASKILAPASQTTPDPIFLHEKLSDMQREGVTHAALEISSHALEQKRAHALALDVAIFTNLTQDHLDFHQDMASYFDAKQKLFTEILAASPKSRRLAVINMDDPYGEKLAQILIDKNKSHDAPFIHVQTFSLKNEAATAFARIEKTSLDGTEATVQFAGRSQPLFTTLIGRHNIQNILTAFLVGTFEGLEARAVLDRIRAVSVPGRLQRVGSQSSTHFFVDYAHTPDALENVLKALRAVLENSHTPTSESMTSKARLICVFGCGGDRDPGKRPLMGGIAARLADVVIITSDNPRTEDPQKIIEAICAGVINTAIPFDGNRGYLVDPDRRSALCQVVQIARPGDAVLVAGKGHEDYQIIGTVKTPFDDAKILQELLGS